MIAKKFGAKVPFIRPARLATDDTPTLPVVQHAIKWLEKNEKYKSDIIVLLEPTSPLRKTEDVDKAIQLLAENRKVDSVRGVCEPEQNPFKMWKIHNGFLKPLIGKKETVNMPRQKLPKIYWQNGYIYVARYETIMKKNSMSGDKILPYIMKKDDKIDIDNPIDLKFAEFILKGE